MKKNIQIGYYENQSNWHHIFAKKGKPKGTNHPENKVRLKVKAHNAIHTLFKNLNPLWQIVKLLKINQSALNPAFVIDILKVLEKHKHTYMNKSCVKK